jgi:hypothetical protein
VAHLKRRKVDDHILILWSTAWWIHMTGTTN